MKIYIVGTEVNIPENGVSSWEWSYSKEFSDNRHEHLKKNFANSKYILYRGEIEISDNVTDVDDITDLVELYLQENDFENAFEDKITI